MDHQAFAQLLGNYGEFVGAIAVVVTLIYLSIQLRQNTATIRSSESAQRTVMEDNITSGFNDINLLVAGSSDLARIYTQGLESPDELNEEEQIQFNFVWRSYMNQYLRLFRLVQAGVFPKERWEPYAQEAAQWSALPGGTAFRDGNQLMSDFWKAIDEVEIAQVASVRLKLDR